MLCFNPDRRISVAEAIEHPYFKSFQHLGKPPASESHFDWSWDQFELSKDLLQKLIYMESLFFHPDKPAATTSSTDLGGAGAEPSPLPSKETNLTTPPPQSEKGAGEEIVVG